MSQTLGLFEGFGIEIEYMIVDQTTLDVMPIADTLLKTTKGDYVNEVEHGPIAWSNELALHVIEQKTNGPAEILGPLVGHFHRGIDEINSKLESSGAKLMPTAMHPWMNPATDMKLWPHGYDEIYAAYHRIFDCRGHGWTNLQSMHINLPFNGNEEFTRLHAAIRVVLPLLPMLAASSPFADGCDTGYSDYRMQTYRHNAKRIPSITGRVVPEAVNGIDDYRQTILAPMYADIAPFDTDGILQEEWLNSRGAITRFDRSAIEIRVLDTQESPHADIAIAAATVALVREIADEKHAGIINLNAFDTDALARLLLEGIEHGEKARIDDRAYLEFFGLRRFGSLTAQKLWAKLIERTPPTDSQLDQPLHNILANGTLATRIRRACGKQPQHTKLMDVYRILVECLGTGTLFYS
ncbi:MAG: glutamate--cysteine ligase [marine bacterium B5-7]|nr:MAG: glutamate--cysteine ligase [marine bacterium B5-7]